MAEARQRDEWSRTSCVLALMVNTAANRDPKRQKAVKPSEFNPFESKRSGRGQPVPIGALKGALMKMGVKVRKAGQSNTEQGGSDADGNTGGTG